MEIYLVIIVILCHFLSIINLVATQLGVISRTRNKIVDAGYHALAGLLLLIGAVVYIVSTEHIKNVTWDINDVRLLRAEKLAAGVSLQYWF